MVSVSDVAREEARRIDLDSLKTAGIERTIEGFYILGNYPPLTAMDDYDEEDLLAGNTQNELDVYMHFQFCEQLCSFCHFYMDQSARNSDDSKVTRYLENLKKEVSMLNERMGGVKARSIYVGGGTPSFMSAEQIRDLFAHVRREFIVPEGITITFDVHPEIMRSVYREEKFDALKQAGVNRISIGGVDLDDKVLRYQNRGHTAKETVELIQALKLSGFSHVVTDLMMGIPHQTAENWERTIEILTGDTCQIDSAMTFPLMFKASQPLWARYQRRTKEFPTIEERIVLQLIAMNKFAEAGYSSGPIYYFNRGQEHMNDQQLRKFETLDETGLLPIGVSSFGFINGCQYFNTPDIAEYNAIVESGRLPVWRAAKLTARQNFERAVMFGMKSRGINKKAVEKKYGLNVDREYADVIRRFEDAGLLESRQEYLRLTRSGELFAEEVCNHFVGEDVRRKAERTAAVTDPKHPIQRYNYNMIGHRLQ
ncbi:coproporphyrinogen III oxidase family protein [Candidatus Woesearchaeota archaeon]|nr:coproporphyrinogen III oxidase family protein [Candidatus Woesearchaeota archaeon]